MYRHRNIGNIGPSASPSSGPSAQTCGGSIGCPSSLIHAAAINTSRADQARRCMWTLMPRVGASFFYYLLLFIYFLFVLAVLFGFFFFPFLHSTRPELFSAAYSPLAGPIVLVHEDLGKRPLVHLEEERLLLHPRCRISVTHAHTQAGRMRRSTHTFSLNTLNLHS